MDEIKQRIIKLYDVYNLFYYNGECIPEYDNLKYSIDFLEEDEPEEIEGRTDLLFSTKKNTAEIVIKIKKDVVLENNILHLSCVLLHEMVHANLFARKIFELDNEKKKAIHGEEFYKTAITHGLKDGYIEPEDTLLLVIGGTAWK